MLEARNNLNFENETSDGVYGMHSKSKANLHSTQLIKLKVQGKRRDIIEFEERFAGVLEDLDCEIFDKTPTLRNRQSEYFRQFIFVGMNRRKDYGKEEG